MSEAAEPSLPAAPAETPEAQSQRWEFAAQWKLAWRTLMWVFWGGVVLGALVVVGQGYLYFQLFADIHPALGYAFVAVLTAAIGWFIVRPLIGFFSMPVMAAPPDVHFDHGAPDAASCAARLRYDLRYLNAMRANPELAEVRAAIDAAYEEGRGLAQRKAQAEDIRRFEAERIVPLLAPLDDKVDKIVRAEAIAVGMSTAVSLNGTIDAFIVLWRNANLIGRVSRIYFGRPHLRGSLRILRDVAAVVLLSRALDDVTDISGEAIGGLLGRFGGVVAGPVLDGAVNALMTLKLGYLAKNRCRSFEAWDAKTARKAAKSVFDRVRKESAGVAAELMKRCGGFASAAAGAAEQTAQSAKNAWSAVQGLFVKRPNPDATPEAG